MQEISISTGKKQQIIDITDRIKTLIRNSKIKSGICHVYTGHATGAIIINENYDPNVGIDILNCLDKLVPPGIWLHDRIDNNGAAHIKSAILGPSEIIPVEDNDLQLGQWQNIIFVELDGPRKRKIYVQIIRGD